MGDFRGSAGAIAGPLLGGVLIAAVGLTGAYLIDIAAMLFAFPVALFPALSLQWGDARMTGILFSSMAIGSLIATLFYRPDPAAPAEPASNNLPA